MTNTTKPEFCFTQSTVTTNGDEGPNEATCLVTELAPGLCISHLNFGSFNVTHLGSGLNLGGAYERAGSAALELAQLQSIAVKLGFSWALEGSEIKALRESNSEFNREMTELAVMAGLEDDFFEDEHPMHAAMKMLGFYEDDDHD